MEMVVMFLGDDRDEGGLVISMNVVRGCLYVFQSADVLAWQTVVERCQNDAKARPWLEQQTQTDSVSRERANDLSSDGQSVPGRGEEFEKGSKWVI
jgi:hypothetical protein